MSEEAPSANPDPPVPALSGLQPGVKDGRPVSAGNGRFLSALLSFAAGLAAALIIDYLLYRVGLPSKPFIYVAF